HARGSPAHSPAAAGPTRPAIHGIGLRSEVSHTRHRVEPRLSTHEPSRRFSGEAGGTVWPNFDQGSLRGAVVRFTGDDLWPGSKSNRRGHTPGRSAGVHRV